MKIRCLLIDDEPPALKVLQSHISQIGGLEIVGLCSNAVEAVEVLHQKKVDVIFLDIKMPKIIGTDFLRSLSHPPQVIFVTAYREYALEGFELEAVDYLVKPVSFERFLKAVSRLQRNKWKNDTVEEKVYESNPEAFVYLKTDRVMHRVLVNEILYIESWKDYVKLFLTCERTLFVKQSISALDNMLSDHQFLRVHRSYIVSLKSITSYDKANVYVQQTEIPIGRLYKQTVMKQLAF
jgi:DNA-binding LytR/AlgR family response regulator